MKILFKKENRVKRLRYANADKPLTVMDWLPESPDLNIMEAAWDHLDRQKKQRQPKSKEKLQKC